MACMNEKAEGAEGEKHRRPSYDESRMSKLNSLVCSKSRNVFGFH